MLEHHNRELANNWTQTNLLFGRCFGPVAQIYTQSAEACSRARDEFCDARWGYVRRVEALERMFGLMLDDHSAFVRRMRPMFAAEIGQQQEMRAERIEEYRFATKQLWQLMRAARMNVPEGAEVAQ